MVNYKVGMIAAILVAAILAGSFAYYAATVQPTVGPEGVTTRVETITLERAVTNVVTRTEVRTVTTTAFATVTKTATPELKKVSIGMLASPSTSSWITFIIDEFDLDKKHGLDIEFVMQPSTAALYQDLRAGTYKIGVIGGLTAANMFNQGVPIKIFLTYQLFGTAIILNTERAPDVRSPKDLEGKVVAGPLAAENTRMMLLFLSLLGVDVSKIQLVNMDQGPAANELRSPTGRAVAAIVWAQLPSILELENPNKFKIVPGTSIPELEQVWFEKTGTRRSWLLTFAAWNEVIEKDPELIQKIYDVFREAVNFMRDFPEDTIKIVSKRTNIAEDVLRDSFEKGRLKFLVLPMHYEKEALFKLYELAAKQGFIDKVPSEDIIYTGLKPVG